MKKRFIKIRIEIILQDTKDIVCASNELEWDEKRSRAANNAIGF